MRADEDRRQDQDETFRQSSWRARAREPITRALTTGISACCRLIHNRKQRPNHEKDVLDEIAERARHHRSTLANIRDARRQILERQTNVRDDCPGCRKCVPLNVDRKL